jgi:hypothetical protein
MEIIRHYDRLDKMWLLACVLSREIAACPPVKRANRGF